MPRTRGREETTIAAGPRSWLSRTGLTVGLVLLLATLLGVTLAVRALELVATQRAELAAKQVGVSLVLELERDLAVLSGLATLLGVEAPGLSAARFAALLDGLQVGGSLGTISAASLLLPVPAATLTTDLAALDPDVRAGLDLRLGPGPEHLLVTHTWPEAVNVAALGFDVLRSPTAAPAARTALAGTPALSPPLERQIDPAGTVTVVAYLPVRDAEGRVVAVASATVPASDLLGLALPAERGVTVRVVDDGTRQEVLRTTAGPLPTSPRVVRLQPVLDRTWRIEVATDAAIHSDLERSLPVVVGLAGLLLAALPVSLVLNARRDERRARSLVAARTEQLRTANAELAALNAALARSNADLASTNTELAALARTKEALLAGVSHDLRAPVAVIRGLTDLLQAGRVPESERADLLGRIDRQAAVLLRRVEDLLTAASLQAGGVRPSPQPVDLVTIVTELTELLEVGALVGERVVRCAWVDPDHLDRILTNLLVNADKHGAPPVEVEIVPGPPGQVTLRVRDHGPGIPAALREAVFTPFERLASNATNGVGLGLAVARELAAINGGELRAEPTEGPGACFTLTLPTGTTVSAPDGTADAAGAVASRRTEPV